MKEEFELVGSTYLQDGLKIAAERLSEKIVRRLNGYEITGEVTTNFAYESLHRLTVNCDTEENKSLHVSIPVKVTVIVETDSDNEQEIEVSTSAIEKFEMPQNDTDKLMRRRGGYHNDRDEDFPRLPDEFFDSVGKI